MSNWIYDLIVGRITNESNVALVETNDIERFKQLKRAMVTQGFVKQLYNAYVEAGLMDSYDVAEQYVLNLKLIRLFKLEKNFLDGEVRYEERRVDTHNPFTVLNDAMTGKETVRKDEYTGYRILRSFIVVIDSVKSKGFVDRILLSHLYEWSQNSMMHRNKSYVIVFTSDLGYFPETLRKECSIVSVYPSTYEERVDWINSRVEAYSRTHNVKIAIPREVYNITGGMNLHDIETALLKSLKLKGEIDLAYINDYKRQLLKQMGYEYVITNRGFESVGGYDYLKDYFRRRIISVLRNPKRAEKYRVQLPRGVLLVGPPGTGKTYVVKALSNEAKIPMLSVSASTFLSKYVGETEQAVRRFLRIADSMSPLIVFMDEIDALFMSRETMSLGDSGTTLRMTNELLSAIGDENRRWLLIGATNRPEAMDWASIRAGRIDEIIFVGYPDREARKEIFRVHTRILYRNVPLAKDVSFSKLADMTAWFSSSEIATICNEARFLAFYNNTPIKMKYFVKLINSKRNRESIDERKEKVSRMVKILDKIEFINRELLEQATSGVKEYVDLGESRVETL